jgi:hypothetical protein
MEIVDFIVKSLILIILVFTSIFCVYKKYSFVKLYLISALVISFMLIIGGYWPNFYTEVRLDLMGYDSLGMSEAERLQNVAPEMHEEATQLHWSNMGVGWPLKVIIWMVILIPYPLIVWVFGLAYNKLKNRFGAKNT